MFQKLDKSLEQLWVDKSKGKVWCFFCGQPKVSKFVSMPMKKGEKKPQLRGKKKLTDAQQKEVAEAFAVRCSVCH